MTQDNNEPKSTFDSLSGIVPPRELDDMPEDVGMDTPRLQGSLRQRMNESPKLTDMQTADKRLFPAVEIDGEVIGWLTNMQIGRVFPDTYVPVRNMIMKHLMREYHKSSVEAYCIADRVLSTAIDGEGRIDELALIGKTGEAADDKKVAL